MAVLVMEYRTRPFDQVAKTAVARDAVPLPVMIANASDAGLGCGGLLTRPPLLAVPAY